MTHCVGVRMFLEENIHPSTGEPCAFVTLLNRIEKFKSFVVVSSGRVEGLNLKAKLTMRKACGFRNVETLQTAPYHTLGKLPEPKITHRFC